MADSPESAPSHLVLGVLGADHAVGPVEDHAPVLLGHAEQLGDHEERELGRDLLDEVGRAALADGVDDAVGVPDDLLLEVAHHLGREALVDQAAVTRVHGRVHVDHHQLLLGQLVVVHLGEERATPGRGEVLPVAVDVDAVVVAGDGPEAAAGGALLGVPVGGGLPAQLGEPLVGHAGHEVAPVDEVDLLEAQGPPFRARRRRTPRRLVPALSRQFLERVSVIIGTAPTRPDRLPGQTRSPRVCSPGGRRSSRPGPSEPRTASLTYCLALRLHEGMLFLADTRTNAGVDNVGTYRKMHVLQPAEDRLFVIESAGSLATTQQVLDRMARDLAAGEATESLATVGHLFEAALYLGRVSREVAAEHKEALARSGPTAPPRSFSVATSATRRPTSCSSTRRATTSAPRTSDPSCRSVRASTASSCWSWRWRRTSTSSPPPRSRSGPC